MVEKEGCQNWMDFDCIGIWPSNRRKHLDKLSVRSNVYALLICAGKIFGRYVHVFGNSTL